jgi:hypothetical protein
VLSSVNNFPRAKLDAYPDFEKNLFKKIQKKIQERQSTAKPFVKK